MDILLVSVNDLNPGRRGRTEEHLAVRVLLTTNVCFSAIAPVTRVALFYSHLNLARRLTLVKPTSAALGDMMNIASTTLRRTPAIIAPASEGEENQSVFWKYCSPTGFYADQLYCSEWW